MTRSSKREPMATITSHSCIAILASYVPCMPTIPRYCGRDAGTAPSPMSVKVTGKSVKSTNSVKSSDARKPELITPPPQYNKGRLACTMASTALSISSAFPSTLGE